MIWLVCQHIINNDEAEKETEEGDQVYCPICKIPVTVQALVSLEPDFDVSSFEVIWNESPIAFITTGGEQEYKSDAS